MASASKTYVVEDADESAKSGIAPGVFPGTLAGLVDALDAARYRSASSTGTPKVLAIVEGNLRTIIRRFEGGQETWSASRVEILRERGDEPEADARRSPGACLRKLRRCHVEREGVLQLRVLNEDVDTRD